MHKLIKAPIETFFRGMGYYPARLNGVEFRCDPYHVGWWRRASLNRWEPHTFEILDRLLDQNRVFLDIGAWIGPTTLYASKRCREVLCLEPDRTAYEHLLLNLRLNGLRNVIPFNVALADTDSMQMMGSFSGQGGDSFTSLLAHTNGGDAFPVMGMRWQTWLDLCKPPKIDVIKVDIEGGEFSLLPSMTSYLAQNKPALYLSIHAPYLDPSRRRESLQRVVDIMRIYRQCLNEQFLPVSFDTLVCDESCDSFKSFIFMD
jgi:FkbM family methyltransferase